jgi:hypothetical protein
MDLVETQGPLVAWEKTVKHMEWRLHFPGRNIGETEDPGPADLSLWIRNQHGPYRSP